MSHKKQIHPGSEEPGILCQGINNPFQKNEITTDSIRRYFE